MISDESRCELASNLRVIAYAGGTCADVMLVLDKACGRFADSLRDIAERRGTWPDVAFALEMGYGGLADYELTRKLADLVYPEGEDGE